MILACRRQCIDTSRSNSELAVENANLMCEMCCDEVCVFESVKKSPWEEQAPVLTNANL